MAANPLYYVDLSQPGDAPNDSPTNDASVDGEVVDVVSAPPEASMLALAPEVALLRSPESEPDHQSSSVAKPSIAELVEQLTAARSAISDAFEFCAASADQMDVTAATFNAAASGLRAAGAEQRGIHAMMSDAIRQIASMNDEIERERATALAEKIEMLDRAQRETEQLRTVALADVDRARSRLLQFTNEFSSVASELQGALATDRVANGHG